MCSLFRSDRRLRRVMPCSLSKSAKMEFPGRSARGCWVRSRSKIGLFLMYLSTTGALRGVSRSHMPLENCLAIEPAAIRRGSGR